METVLSAAVDAELTAELSADSEAAAFSVSADSERTSSRRRFSQSFLRFDVDFVCGRYLAVDSGDASGSDCFSISCGCDRPRLDARQLSGIASGGFSARRLSLETRRPALEARRRRSVAGELGREQPPEAVLLRCQSAASSRSQLEVRRGGRRRRGPRRRRSTTVDSATEVNEVCSEPQPLVPLQPFPPPLLLLKRDSQLGKQRRW